MARVTKNGMADAPLFRPTGLLKLKCEQVSVFEFKDQLDGFSRQRADIGFYILACLPFNRAV